MKEHVGRRVLVTVGENDAPRMTCVRVVSPNGKYVLLIDDCAAGEHLGWQPVEIVKVLDVLGDQWERQSDMYLRLSKVTA